MAEADRFITSYDGTRIFVREDGVESGPPLLLSNSLGTTMAMWQPQMDDFARHFRVIRYDARGHGRSDAPAGDYSMDMLARDALAVIDELRISRTAFLGLSIGGTVGLWLASQLPERITRLAVASSAPYYPMPDVWNELAATARDKGAAATAQWFLERWFTPDFRKDHEDEYQALLKSAQTEITPQGYAGFCVALRDVDLRAALPAITAPTLFIAGRHDATPIAVVEGIASSVPDARVVVIENAAHISNMEQPRAFTRAAVDFLKR
jgi:3-oxoadipate enol-lactonase